MGNYPVIILCYLRVAAAIFWSLALSFSPAQRLAAQALSNYGRSNMSFGNSLLVALFLMLVVFVALFSLFLFVTLFSLIVQTMEFSAKRKKAAQH